MRPESRILGHAVEDLIHHLSEGYVIVHNQYLHLLSIFIHFCNLYLMSFFINLEMQLFRGRRRLKSSAGVRVAASIQEIGAIIDGKGKIQLRDNARLVPQFAEAHSFPDRKKFRFSER